MSVQMIQYGDVRKAIEEGNENAILEILIGVTAQAKSLAPVDKGQLRNSIMYRTSKKEGGFNSDGGESAPSQLTEQPKAGGGVSGSNLLHAIYNEFGTRKMAAQPFLRPSISVVTGGGKAAQIISKLQKESVAAGMRKGPRKKKEFK
jgi:HK97 gp10 family phage protein